ncbi:MAG TPA: response regulator transcription factor [Gemmatimonadaceae bacterium]
MGIPVAAAPIRVLIADDHEIVREGLRALVDAQPGIQVVGEASNAEEAWRRACELSPDVVVLDLSMPPGMASAEAAERIGRDCPQVKVLALTMHEERGYVTRMLRAGAAGYVLKRTAASELVRAIRAVASGGSYVDPSLAGALLTETPRAPRATDGAGAATSAALTAREQEVLRLLALGHSNKEISATLSISVKTVETHRASGMARLGLSSRAALVRFAMNEGWLGA